MPKKNKGREMRAKRGPSLPTGPAPILPKAQTLIQPKLQMRAAPPKRAPVGKKPDGASTSPLLKGNKQSKFWRKRLAADPDNSIYKRLVSMTNQERSYTPCKLPEIEEQEPMELGRGGHCNVALEVLLELYPEGKPYKLTRNGKDYPHVFLMFKGQPLDICGVTSMAEMRAHYKDDSLVAVAISLKEMEKAFRGWQTPDERTRLIAHFKKHILDNLGKSFPHPELLNTN